MNSTVSSAPSCCRAFFRFISSAVEKQLLMNIRPNLDSLVLCLSYFGLTGQESSTFWEKKYVLNLCRVFSTSSNRPLLRSAYSFFNAEKAEWSYNRISLSATAASRKLRDSTNSMKCTFKLKWTELKCCFYLFCSAFKLISPCKLLAR